jgi:cyclase
MTYATLRHLVRSLLLSMLVLSMAAGTVLADAVHTKERTVTQLAPGVYEIRHKDAPSGFPNGNTTVIIGDREVLVVDSCYLPSEARADIAQIRQWTDKPVRYLVNTHWHNDHVVGNSAYAEAFPSLTIIAHMETANMMKGFIAKSIERYPRATDAMKRSLESGIDKDGRPLTDAEKKDITNQLPGRALVAAELKNLVVHMPSLTFERELDLNLGNREVQMKYLGHGNTAGDAVVFLPKERLLITGDIVVHPVPYLCSGFPSEWAETLQRMIDLAPQTIVPGHGEVLHDTGYLIQVKQLLTTVVTHVRKVFFVQGNDGGFEDLQKSVRQTFDFEALRRQFDSGDKDNFAQSDAIPTCLVRTAYYEVAIR